jgi:hypothetical protein
MNGEPEILPAANLREFFRDMLATARQHQRLEVQEDTEFYLVNLLAECLSTEHLFGNAEPGSREPEPLAFILKRAQEAHGLERVRELKKLGDTSLYVSGFFADSLEGKLVDVDYYVSMGGRAYGVLSDIFNGGGTGALYSELAQKFVKLVDLIAEVSERAALGTNKGLVKVYERFLRTGSDRMARLLCEQGVLPMAKPGLVQ